ncbi:MAG: DUF2878 domain-containing protein [Gammaproteobacteria bacterium]|nr:DUF2878 domain-containing protein [Gammaproteobacteria bacterium]
MSQWQWIQLGGFNIFWIISVIGQNDFILFQLICLVLFFIYTPNRAKNFILLPLALIGILVDVLLIKSGVFIFEVFPIWLLLLWVGFVVTLNHGFFWLTALQYPIIALIGAIAGPLSYLSGYYLGAVSLAYSELISFLILAPIWFFLLPLLVYLSRKFNNG